MKEAYIVCLQKTHVYSKLVASLAAFKIKTTDIINCNKKQQFTVALGGDGTVLAAARLKVKNPILAVNTGHLGFLSSCTWDNHVEGIRCMAYNQYTTSHRDMLDLTINGQSYLALNDIVISKSGVAKLVKLAVYVVTNTSEELISEYRADGLIVSSPTGSTAYSLSASGPIIHPSCDVMLVTPICPQGLTQRPLVLPANTKLRIKPLDSELFASIDGQESFVMGLSPITISRARHHIDIVNPCSSYFEVLRAKLGWGIKPV